jgi:hypothetical protein
LVEVSWPEAERRVDDIANGLLAVGVRKGGLWHLASTSLGGACSTSLQPAWAR